MSCRCMTCEAFFCVCSLTNAHGVDVCMYVCMYVCVCVPGATATTINAVCHKCGIISKSAKISCCGRGGSWFRNCGSVGNAKLDHTWHEGIRVCSGRPVDQVAARVVLDPREKFRTRTHPLGGHVFVCVWGGGGGAGEGVEVGMNVQGGMNVQVQVGIGVEGGGMLIVG